MQPFRDGASSKRWLVAALLVCAPLLGESNIVTRRRVATAGTAGAANRPPHGLLLRKGAEEPVDYNRETSVHLPDPVEDATGERKMPVSLEGIVGLVWIAIVGGMPLMIISLDKEPITKTHWTVSIITWIVLFGGFVLFTHVLWFQSAHFEGERSLTIVESVYVMSQILTTVGYGDITPSRPRGQVFVGIYVFFAILIIANIVSEVSVLVVARTSEFAKKLAKRAASRAQAEVKPVCEEVQEFVEKYSPRGTHLLPQKKAAPTEEHLAAAKIQRQYKKKKTAEIAARDETDPSEPEAPALDYKPFILAIITCVCFIAAGVCFFVNYPGEGKGKLEAVYMAVITLSTVGFGVVTPTTEGGKIFGSFWMLFGTGALVNVVSRFTELCINVKAIELHKRRIEETREFKIEQEAKLPGLVSFDEFMEYMLLRTDFVDKEQVATFKREFKELESGDYWSDGKVERDTIMLSEYGESAGGGLID